MRIEIINLSEWNKKLASIKMDSEAMRIGETLSSVKRINQVSEQYSSEGKSKE